MKAPEGKLQTTPADVRRTLHQLAMKARKRGQSFDDFIEFVAAKFPSAAEVLRDDWQEPMYQLVWKRGALS